MEAVNRFSLLVIGDDVGHQVGIDPTDGSVIYIRHLEHRWNPRVPSATINVDPIGHPPLGFDCLLPHRRKVLNDHCHPCFDE